MIDFNRVQHTDLPKSLKIAKYLMLLHIVLFIAVMLPSLKNGIPHPSLILYVAFYSYMVFLIQSQTTKTYGSLLLVCLLLPAYIIYSSFIDPSRSDATRLLIIVYDAPLFLAAMLLFIGREFYLSTNPNKSVK